MFKFSHSFLINSIASILIILMLLPLTSNASSFESAKVSVQLWSVKDDLKADFNATIKALADMGFEGLEFAGDFGPYADNPRALRNKLDDLNLVASSAHIGFDKLSDTQLMGTLLFYKTLGVSNLFVPWDERAWDPTGIMPLAKQLKELNEIAQKYDMYIGFHNHNKEFEQFNNETYWDALASNTPNELPLQLDIGWLHYAGKEPVYFIKKYAGRTYAAHLKVRTHKDDGLNPIFGENNYPWKKIINSLITDGGTKWLVIEQEEFPAGMSPLQSVAKSKANLDKILKAMQN
ncbi:sugar phosphate isomerase/epimerase family protein [Pseudoalteromonas sp. H105]|uniref:sugar phosphate isomerase/epimerase family protein n=1 Tax=Pseudoalteromonas sp. H105 TaxID=1348393 RepID=UPI000731FFDD|nr:sugar phosphate isomerase/epimerase [Pseudoalteromonas sp. H105]KTF16828.1 sugar phosphate isomerase [Pseudoalteromonas sp. H105]